MGILDLPAVSFIDWSTMDRVTLDPAIINLTVDMPLRLSMDLTTVDLFNKDVPDAVVNLTKIDPPAVGLVIRSILYFPDVGLAGVDFAVIDLMNLLSCVGP